MGRARSPIRWSGSRFEALAFSPDGQRLAVGTVTGRLLLFDLIEQKTLWSIHAYGSDGLGVKALAYSPDGRFIATGFGGAFGAPTGPGGRYEPQRIVNPLAIWDAATGNLFRGVTGASQEIADLSWSADGRTLAATQDDDSVRFWVVNSSVGAAATLRLRGPVTSVAFAPDKMKFIAAGNKAAVIGEILSR